MILALNTRTWNRVGLSRFKNSRSSRKNIRRWNRICSARNWKPKGWERRKLILPMKFFIWGLSELIRCWRLRRWKMNGDRSINWKPNYCLIIQSWRPEFDSWMSKIEISWWQTKIWKTTLAKHKPHWMKPKVTCWHRICWAHSYPSNCLTPSWNFKIKRWFPIGRSMSWNWICRFWEKELWNRNKSYSRRSRRYLRLKAPLEFWLLIGSIWDKTSKDSKNVRNAFDKNYRKWGRRTRKLSDWWHNRRVKTE